MKIPKKDLHDIQCEKANDSHELINLIVKEQYKSYTILKKVNLRSLKIIESTEICKESNALLCASDEKMSLSLLCPFKIF